MKVAIFGAACAVCFSTMTWAQTTPAAAPSSSAQPSSSSTASGAGQGYGLDTPIETLVADPAAKAVLDKDVPTLTTNPAFDAFKGMSLKDLQPLSGGALTDALLAKVQTDLHALPVKK